METSCISQKVRTFLLLKLWPLTFFLCFCVLPFVGREIKQVSLYRVWKTSKFEHAES